MISCYLCDKRYIKGEVFNVYLCYDCHNKTSFCLNCDKIMMKIFEYNNMFKCGSCKKICPAISKDLIEVTNPIDLNPFLNISGINDNIFTPQKNIINKNNNNNIEFNINSYINSPNDYKILNQLSGNKIKINSPSLNSPFINNFQNKNQVLNFNNNIVQNNNMLNNKNIINNNDNNRIINNDNDKNIDNNNSKEDSNISCLTDNNTKAKIKNKFHLVMNDNSKSVIKDSHKIVEYFINK